MKRGVWILLPIVMLLSCSDSVIGPEEAIVGSWRIAQGGSTVTWTFLNTGSLRVVTEVDEVGASFFATTYRMDGDRVTIQAFTGSDDQSNPVSFPAASCQVEINDRIMRMTCETGVTTFSRVGPGSEDNAV
jgi:hypothetical protein